MTGATRGRMMWRRRFQPPAPSISAASSTSGESLGQAGVDRQGDEGHAHPHDDDGRDDEERERLDEPVVALGVDAEALERPVEQAVAPVDDPRPHRHRGDDGHGPGEQERDLEHEAASAADRAHEQGEAEADRHRRQGAHEAEGEGAPDDDPQARGRSRATRSSRGPPTRAAGRTAASSRSAGRLVTTCHPTG